MVEFPKLTDLVQRYENPYIRALVQLLPTVGGPLDTILGAIVAGINQERAKTFFDELAAGAQKLDSDTAKSEPFLHAYLSTVRAVQSTRQREKIQFLARLLAAGTRGGVEYGDDYEELLSILEETSYPELLTLARLAELESQHPYAWFHTNERETDGQRADRIWKAFTAGFGSLSEDDIRAHLTRLSRTGLYEPLTSTSYDNEGGRGRTTPLYRRLASSIQPHDAPSRAQPSLADFKLTDVRFQQNSAISPDAIVHSKVTAQIVYQGKQSVSGRTLRVVIEYLDGDQVQNGVTYAITIAEFPKPTIFRGEFSERIKGIDTRCRIRISELVPLQGVR